MHSLDTAIAQSCLQNTIRSASPQAVLRIDYANRNGSQWTFLREFIPLPRKVNRFNVGRIGLWRDKIRIKAVLTIESSGLTQANQDFNLGFDFHSKSSSIAGDEYQSTSEEDSIALQESEKIRRMRISKANRGNTPWNKGRKHSPETLQRIRERTRLAMQDPKVKMKLVNSGHAQSKETRIKIGVGVRMGWEKRRKKMLLQETCLSDWQNFIAKAAKGGLLGEEELQWDSYRILDKQLKQEWMQSVEQRKKVSKPKGSKRAPKSLEQRRKISEAISAKWSDPEYRDRVYSGLSKYHGIAEGIGRKPKRNPTSSGESRRRQPSKRKADCNDPATAKPKPKSQTKRVRPRSSIPEYKDPLVGSKLEMLKNIRAQRAAAERNKSEAVIRAKALIAEAETAVKVLEEAAKKSPIAQASLVEARKLIDEAIQSIASIEKGQADSQSVGSSSVSSIESNTANIGDEMNVELEEYNEIAPKNSMESSNNIINGYNKAVFENFLNENDDDQSSIFMTYNSSVNGKENGVPPLLLDDAVVNLSSFAGGNEQNGGLGHAKSSLFNGVHPSKEEEEEEEEEEERTQPKPATTTKKWVRGKLVEVTEGC